MWTPKLRWALVGLILVLGGIAGAVLAVKSDDSGDGKAGGQAGTTISDSTDTFTHPSPSTTKPQPQPVAAPCGRKDSSGGSPSDQPNSAANARLITGPGPYSGKISTDQDADWLAFCSPKEQDVTVKLSLTGCPAPDPAAGGCANLFGELTDESGEPLTDSSADLYTSGTKTLASTVPRGSFRLHISGERGNQWRFTISAPRGLSRTIPN